MGAPTVPCGRSTSSASSSRRAHASAVAQQYEKFTAYSVVRRRSRGEFSFLSGVIHLICCFCIFSHTILCSAGQLAGSDAEKPPAEDLQEPSLGNTTNTWDVMESLGKAILLHTSLMIAKGRCDGSRLPSTPLTKRQRMRDFIKERDRNAGMTIVNTLGTAADTALKASRKTKHAVANAWTNVKGTNRKLWRSTGKNLQKLGTWMLGDDGGTR